MFKVKIHSRTLGNNVSIKAYAEHMSVNTTNIENINKMWYYEILQ